MCVVHPRARVLHACRAILGCRHCVGRKERGDAKYDKCLSYLFHLVTHSCHHPPSYLPTCDTHYMKKSSNGTTLELRYINNKSITILGGEEEGPNTTSSSPSSSAVLSVNSSLDADGANTAVFNIALDDMQAARALRDGIAQARSAMLLRLEDALSEACAEAIAPTILVYDVSGPGGSARDKLSMALKKLGCKATFVESWSAALEALQEDQGAAGAAGSSSTYAAFLCDIKPEGGWSRIEAGGERGTSGWDLARTLRQLASDDAGAADAEGGAGGSATGPGAGAGRTGGASILRRCKTGVPMIGIGTMNGDETAKDPRAATVPVSSVICHCEEAGMLSYVQKPLTAPKLRTALTGIVPGVRRLFPGEGEEDEEDLEDEEHIDDALEEWSQTGGWISMLAMVPFRVSRYALKRCRRFLPLWMVHILGNAFGAHFKNR